MSPAKPIVVYRLGSLGDTVVALPCFHLIARSFPGSERVLLTNVPVSTKAAPLAAILGGSGLIGRVVAYPANLRSARALLALRAELRATGADTLVYLAEKRGLVSAFRDLLFFRFCGFSRIVGVPLTPDLQANRRDPVSGEVEPEYGRLGRTLRPLGPIDVADRTNWDLRLTGTEREAGRLAIAPLGGRPFLGVNMGGKAAEKDWGAARWEALLDEVGRRVPGLGLLVVGAGEDRERADAVVSRWPGPAVDSCGRLAPRETAAALTSASAFVGHDSGPLHLASAMGVACVGLFGGYNQPREWHPYGTRHRIIHRMGGVQEITVAEVAQATCALLADAGLPPA